MKRICFLIRQLNTGGAQKQLAALVAQLAPRADTEVTVMTFYRGGQFSGVVEDISGVVTVSLGKRGRWDVFGFIFRLVTALRSARPDAVYSFLSSANALVALAKPFLPGVRIVWGIRSAYMDMSRYGVLEKLLAELERALSRRADLIIANSQAGRDYAVSRGFPSHKIRVIYNGIDTTEFAPSPEEREQVRKEWGAGSDETLIGLVGRIDPMKDHETFLKAASIVSARNPRLRFVCVGGGDPAYVDEMCSIGESLGISERVIWAGARSDMRAVYNALDVLALTSYGESFPNVVAEAMACETPCVVTDVGDCAAIVGDTRMVVPAKHPEAFAEALGLMLQSDRETLGREARARIRELFSIERMVSETEDALCPSD